MATKRRMKINGYVKSYGDDDATSETSPETSARASAARAALGRRAAAAPHSSMSADVSQLLCGLAIDIPMRSMTINKTGDRLRRRPRMLKFSFVIFSTRKWACESYICIASMESRPRHIRGLDLLTVRPCPVSSAPGSSLRWSVLVRRPPHPGLYVTTRLATLALVPPCPLRYGFTRTISTDL
ncbi:hypothetical protein EVAR_31089_1 [Eumeta japonica]|uniref:Uncharacterized protein n=1 Tax=Eumeta variegata TaxID=151549 RepID=A0A4C1XD01_EUMVA|nr:hypothetical protein EVAR_31089_1 [Eumeta japonica]